MKTCTRCGTERPYSDFHRRSDGMADGYRAHCKPCVRAANRDLWKRNGKTWARRDQREYLRVYRLTHPRPHDPALAREKYLANRERALEGSRRWAAANRDRKTQATANYRARKAGVFRERIYRKKVWEQHNGACGICNRPCDPANWHLDHIIPIFRGGEHSYANVQPAHPTCNLRKWAHLPEELAA